MTIPLHLIFTRVLKQVFFPTSSASPPVSVSLPDALQAETSSVASSDISMCSMDDRKSLNQFQNPVYHPEPNENSSLKNFYTHLLVTTSHIPIRNDSALVVAVQCSSGYVFSTNICSNSSVVPLEDSNTEGG